MHGMIRSYSGAGAKELFDAIVARKAEIEKTMKSVPGLVSYTLIQTGDGGHSVTVCEDKKGTDESARVAKEWIQANVPGSKTNPPTVSEGTVGIRV
jgi:hypothetical protein